MQGIHVVARHTIKPGKLDEFKRIGQLAFDIARDKEPNTEQYEWFFNDDQSMCVVLHRYTDVASFHEHFANLTEIREQLLAVGEIVAEVYGDIPADAMPVFLEIGAKVYTRFQGFRR